MNYIVSFFMIRLLSLVIPALFSLSFAGIVWETDFSGAQKKAVEQEKDLFLLFTNSEGELEAGKPGYAALDDEAFARQVGDDYVFVRINCYPIFSQTDEKKRRLNSTLATQYGVSRFTLAVIFANSEGKPYYAFTGEYPLDKTIEQVKTAHEIKPKFDAAMRNFHSALGKDRYKLIGDIVRPLPEPIANAYYEDLIQDTIDKDDQDFSGLRYSEKRKEQEESLIKYLDSMVDQVASSPLEAIKNIEIYSNSPSLFPESRQILMAQTAFIMADIGMADEAVARLKQALELAPASSNAEEFRKIKENIEKNRQMIIDYGKKNVKSGPPY